MKVSLLKNNRGGAIIMVLVFAAVFVMAVGSLLQFVLQQSVSGRGKVAREQSLQIAEAGLEYYKWHLAHNPTSEWSGTKEYQDPQTGLRTGEFTITSTVNKQCGQIMNRDVSVTGQADIDTRFTRTVGARYMNPSVANYSYIFNSGVWMDVTDDVIGPLHSNQGIRMEGTHNSTIASALSTWSCDSTYGCNPTVQKNGVWGGGSNPELWKYPSNTIDFTQMNVDFAAMKVNAQSSGRYFPSISNGAGNKGYRLLFKSNGTFDVYRVNSASYNWGWHGDGSITRDYHTITSETFIGNYTVPSSCSLIFVEDQVWLEGVVSGKVAIVAADLVHNYNPDIILHDNLTKAGGAEDDGITVIAEKDILISAKSPENLTIEAVLSAPNGKIGRNHYVETAGSYWNNGWVVMSGVGNKQDLGVYTINGSSVSNERVATTWQYNVYKLGGSWPGYHLELQTSGFTSSINSYERALALDPPPFAPSASIVPYYSNWHEK